MNRARMLRSAAARRGGFTLLEALVALTMLLAAFGGLAATLDRVQRASHEARVEGGLQVDSQRALLALAADLRRSGVVEFSDVRFPHLFERGDPGPGLEHHAHAPAQSAAQAGDPDFGPTREVVFLLPADEDGDEHPDIDDEGRLEWGMDELSYVLVTRADGRNVLERRVNGAAPMAVAYDVERVCFDDAASSQWELPLGCVRIRIWFRRIDASGSLHRWFAETLVALNVTESL